jgi:uncharacterized protein (DUF488 family)
MDHFPLQQDLLAGSPADPERKVFSLGTDLRSEEDFVEILRSYDIGTLVDVRSSPKSKIKTYTREYLKLLLEQEGIAYIFMGRELGGFRKGGYEAYTATDAFRAGMDSLEQIIGQTRSVIVCAERFPWKCHRRWIARELHRRGWTVEHIIDKGRIWKPH